MEDLRIKTTLGIRPMHEPKHEILVITRGATARIDYNLMTKVYNDLNYVDQMTFMFKQGKNIWAYNLIDYFALTTDTEILAGKNYYTKHIPNLPDTTPAEFKLVEPMVGANPKALGWYEEHELEDGEYADDNWRFNRHFSYDVSSITNVVTLMLSSDDTKQFKLTAPDNNMEFEIAVKLNTDIFNNKDYHGVDSVIIDKRHPIAVVDSIYSKLGSHSGGDIVITSSVCGENTYCSENLICK